MKIRVLQTKIIPYLAKVVNPCWSILDNTETLWYSSDTNRGKKCNFGLKMMYKQIQLTDKELEILHQVLGWFLTEKAHKDNPHYVNAHIMMRHISGKLSHENRNQIVFSGK